MQTFTSAAVLPEAQLRNALLPTSLRVWQNSSPYGCRTEAHVFFLAVSWSSYGLPTLPWHVALSMGSSQCGYLLLQGQQEHLSPQSARLKCHITKCINWSHILLPLAHNVNQSGEWHPSPCPHCVAWKQVTSPACVQERRSY